MNSIRRLYLNASARMPSMMGHPLCGSLCSASSARNTSSTTFARHQPHSSVLSRSLFSGRDSKESIISFHFEKIRVTSNSGHLVRASSGPIIFRDGRHPLASTRFMSTRNDFINDERSEGHHAGGVRIASLLSKHLGTSRRQSERMVLTERVTLFGKVVTSPSLLLYPSNDHLAIKVDGRLLQDVEKTLESLYSEQLQEARNAPSKVDGKGSNNIFKKQSHATNQEFSSDTRVWLANKFKGELITEDDPDGRPSMLQRLTRGGVGSGKKTASGVRTQIHLKPVGRLDMMTEGLMIFTNDGKYARALELPVNQLWRTYRVRVHGRLTPGKMQAMRKGLTVRENDPISGADPSIAQSTGRMVKYKGMKVSIERKALSKTRPRSRGGRARQSGGGGGTNTWLQITCTEGKNRQLRRILGSLGLDVTRLIRISYGDYDLNTIPPGLAVEVPVKSLESMTKRGPLFVKDGKEKEKSSRNNNLDSQQAAGVEWVNYS